MRSPSRSALNLVALTVAAALTLGACSSGSGGEKKNTAASASVSTTPSPSSTVSVPAGAKVTDQGSKLPFGGAATVVFEPTQRRGSVLRLTVKSVRRGRLSDFKGFILDDSYKRKAAYYYARVRVRNVGEGDVGGVAVPLWGVNAANTLLPAVNFTTTFATCPSRPLPAKFPAGATLSTCLVYLSPNRSPLTAVSYRPSQQFNPITWTGTIAKPAAPAAAPKKKKKKKG